MTHVTTRAALLSGLVLLGCYGSGERAADPDAGRDATIEADSAAALDSGEAGIPGARTIVQSICQEDFGPALGAVVDAIGDANEPTEICVSGG